eukprot:765245-Hanusia_phi.AAC.2
MGRHGGTERIRFKEEEVAARRRRDSEQVKQARDKKQAWWGVGEACGQSGVVWCMVGGDEEQIRKVEVEVEVEIMTCWLAGREGCQYSDGDDDGAEVLPCQTSSFSLNRAFAFLPGSTNAEAPLVESSSIDPQVSRSQVLTESSSLTDLTQDMSVRVAFLRPVLQAARVLSGARLVGTPGGDVISGLTEFEL